MAYSGPSDHGDVHDIDTSEMSEESSTDSKDHKESAMADDSWLGHPIPIVLAKDRAANSGFSLDVESLEEILLQEHIRDKKVVVISVAGAFRKGKSFLLNFFLRYLYNNGAYDWLGDKTSPLHGFTWRGGSERDTSGILMWSDVFLIRLTSGEEVAVVLLDTQGAFDSQSTVKECATIFALSTMLSSTEVYNLSMNIQEDDLQHLQLFTEYGRLALETSTSKPFQSLVFLVRDWNYPYEADYGLDGGEQILKKRLQISEKQHVELQQVRQHINKCFSNVSCFLCPHPGLKVATSPKFDGRISDIDEEFTTQLKVLVPFILSPSSLVVKKINGVKITCQDLVHYFKAYMEIYKGDSLPEPKSMLLATAEANNLAAVAAAKEVYKKGMHEVCGGDSAYCAPDRLLDQNEKYRMLALVHFRATKKMGDEDFCAKYEDELAKALAEEYGEFVKTNESKNLFSAARAPAVLFAVMIVFYLVSTVLGFLSLFALANLANLSMGLTLCMLCAWSYCRYTGTQREVMQLIEQFADVVWDNILGHGVKRIVEGPLKDKGIIAHAVGSAISQNSVGRKKND